MTCQAPQQLNHLCLWHAWRECGQHVGSCNLFPPGWGQGFDQVQPRAVEQYLDLVAAAQRAYARGQTIEEGFTRVHGLPEAKAMVDNDGPQNIIRLAGKSLSEVQVVPRTNTPLW
jgi:hypothetical protein